MDIGKWLYQKKPDDQIFLRDEVTELLEAFQNSLAAGHTEPEKTCLSCKDAELDAAWNEIHCCDDVRLDQGLAAAISDLQRLRVAAEEQSGNLLSVLKAIDVQLDCPARNTNRGYRYAEATVISSDLRQQVKEAIAKNSTHG